jgi:hypothetical protein
MIAGTWEEIGEKSVTKHKRFANLPLVREIQRFFLRNIANNKVVEHKPGATEIASFFSFRD